MHFKIICNSLWTLTTSSTTNDVRMPMRSQFKSASNSTFAIGISRDSTQRLARHYDLNMLVGRKREKMQTFDAVLYQQYLEKRWLFGGGSQDKTDDAINKESIVDVISGEKHIETYDCNDSEA